MYIYIYIYIIHIYTYTHTYIHIYTYIYTQKHTCIHANIKHIHKLCQPSLSLDASTRLHITSILLIISSFLLQYFENVSGVFGMLFLYEVESLPHFCFVLLS